MFKQEKFSVLISVYYKENSDFLKLALRSIWEEQELKPSEIIIVEDGPLPQQLSDIIIEYSYDKPILNIKFEENMGLGEALKIGVENSSYEIIARMDTDDISKPNRFEKQFNYLQKHTKCDVVGSWIEIFEDNIEDIKFLKKLPSTHNEIIKFLKYRCPFNHPTVMFRRRAVLAAGNYDSSFLKEDMSLWLRMSNDKCKFANIPESLLYFRQSKDTFKRRGGKKYALSEIKMFKLRKDFNLINFFEFLIYLTATITIRLIPPNARENVYKLLLRYKS